MLLLQDPYELNVIFKGRFWKDVEGTGRLDYIKAGFNQNVVDCVPLLLVTPNVHAVPLKTADQPLHEGRGIDESKYSVGQRDH